MQIQYSTDPRFFRMFIAGWWFGTCFIFPYIGLLIIPIDFHIFQRGSNHQPDCENGIDMNWSSWVCQSVPADDRYGAPSGGWVHWSAKQVRLGDRSQDRPRGVDCWENRPESHGKFYHGFSHEIFGFFLQHFLWNKSTNLWFFFRAGKWWTWAGLVNQVTLQRSDSSDMNIWLQTWTSCTLVQGSSENRLRSMLTQAPPSSLCARQGCCGCRVFRDQHTTILGSM